MSKDKQETIPAHVQSYASLDKQLEQALEFADRVKVDAVADVLSGKSVEDAQLIAIGLTKRIGETKQRKTRWPELDAWIESKLREKRYTNDQLFYLISEDGRKIYRDGEQIAVDGKARTLGRAGFNKRVTAIRAKLKNSVNG